MNKWTHAAFLLVVAMTLGCKKESPDHKFIQGLPISTDQTVIPALATQQMWLLQDDATEVIISIINRLEITAPLYPELTPVGGMHYEFTVRDPHYGSATFDVEFRDIGNATIDPVATQSSSATLSSVLLTIANSESSLFPTISQSINITLEPAGTVTNDENMTGTFDIAGSGYDLQFTIPAPGLTLTFDGPKLGEVQGQGTGPTANVTLALSASKDRTLNGQIEWENQQGQLHLDEVGKGLIVSNEERILFE